MAVAPVFTRAILRTVSAKAAMSSSPCAAPASEKVRPEGQASASRLLVLQPTDFLDFTAAGCTQRLLLTNPSAGFTAFAVQTNARTEFVVKPSLGVLRAGTSREVEVVWLPSERAQPEEGALFRVLGTAVDSLLPPQWEQLLQQSPKPPLFEAQLRARVPCSAAAAPRLGPALLRLEPSDALEFQDAGLPADLWLTNASQGTVAFRASASSPERYLLRPEAGTLEPGCSQRLGVTLRFSPSARPLETDRFLVQAQPASAEPLTWDAAEEPVWQTELRASCPEASEESSSPEPVAVLPAAALGDLSHGVLNFSDDSSGGARSAGCRGVVRTLSFRNRSTGFLAWQVRTNAQREYIVRPSSGTLPPACTVEMSVEQRLLPREAGPVDHRLLVRCCPVPAPDFVSWDKWITDLPKEAMQETEVVLLQPEDALTPPTASSPRWHEARVDIDDDSVSQLCWAPFVENVEVAQALGAERSNAWISDMKENMVELVRVCQHFSAIAPGPARQSQRVGDGIERGTGLRLPWVAAS